MQFLKSISALAFAAQALAAQTRYQFFAKSDFDQIDGHGLTYVHEGAAIDYFFVQQDDLASAAILTYDDEQQEFFFQVSPQVKLSLTKGGDILSLSAGTPFKATIGEDGLASFDGSDTLHAVAHLDIPNAGDDYAVIVGDFKGGFPFTIEAREYAI
ncbi:hypothetical protein CORT_0C00820 [Candida orthopsilosis Co 90-125]|uniref:Uncharacterized protein n=1 Tax=Candida orthopsilosis (strain 90-125) TaxID=1136231 RepID=H8X3I6_CANO9|nr:hypothetical protein CORT_0C00820 [Candida orthopsilosis Co 90-125]CCG25459.1 hypothetical protein CORT_0C00820 [Candida orthopsilosis Co 90-125]